MHVQSAWKVSLQLGNMDIRVSNMGLIIFDGLVYLFLKCLIK